MPWYISLPGSVIIIFVLLSFYKKLSIGLIMFLGGITLGVLDGLSLSDLLIVVRASLLNNVTIFLMVSILLLGVLGHVLTATGSFDIMIKSLVVIIADLRLVAASLPMLIGMLTVHGGAILSAPMIKELGARLNLPAQRQASVNLWFRHILYFMLPIYPGLILASELSGINIASFVLHNLHLTIIGFGCAFFYLFRGLPKCGFYGSVSRDRGQALTFLRSLLPVLLVISLVLFLDLFFPLALSLGILLALLNYLPHQDWQKTIYFRLKTMLLPGIKIKVAFVIVGIMFFKEMLEYTAVVLGFTNLLLSLEVPIIYLIVAVPFLVGVLIGDNFAGVGILFPLFMPLLPKEGTTFVSYLALLYVSSTAGYIISPAHLCFSLTKEYFNVDIKSIVKEIFPLLIIILSVAFITALL